MTGKQIRGLEAKSYLSGFQQICATDNRCLSLNSMCSNSPKLDGCLQLFFTVSAITREENNQLKMLDLNFTLHCFFEKFMPWEVLFVTKIPSASWNVMIWAQHGRTDIFVLGNMSTYEEFFFKSDKIYSWKFVMLISALCLLKAGYEM